MKFEILFADDSIRTIEAKNISQAAEQNPEALSIKSIDKIKLKNNLKNLKDDLSSFSYLAPSEIIPMFRRILERNGFYFPAEIAEIGSSADGSINIDIGGAYLHVSWHKMEVSGKFEIVAYVN